MISAAAQPFTCRQVGLQCLSPMCKKHLPSNRSFFTECHRTPTFPDRYASGPNDVWSLGIILVNLTCGRNPWRRASLEDSTYRAYLKNPNFLQQILPISPELNLILSRIFDPDPWRRISIPELKVLVMSCPRFTTRTPLRSRPIITHSPETFTTPHTTSPELFFQQSPPSPTYSIKEQRSASSSDGSMSTAGSTFSAASECSSISSHGSFESVPKPQLVLFPPQASFYDNRNSQVHCGSPIAHQPQPQQAQPQQDLSAYLNPLSTVC